MASKLPEVIGLVGPIRAGKTTITQYLSERYGYVIASNSEILKKILIDLGLDHTRDNLGMLGNSIFSIFGNDLIARYRLENLHLGRIVVDGIRYTEELRQYRNASGFKLLGVQAFDDIRFTRAILYPEGHKDLQLTRSKFNEMLLARSELDVPSLLAGADKVLYNNGSLDQLLLQVDQAIQDWTA
ncbi:hypothetical protein [Pseudomonas congelans]|uniref:hypothetical protein n=1 Tax=Pseudomonas congelans TaxID=200452 RepID=UPI001BDDB89E|nr:hypothetical protein [Pseudomonas congelans]QVX12493.1 hypothetical protein DBV21_22775 [Pseudomonas congelans]